MKTSQQIVSVLLMLPLCLATACATDPDPEPDTAAVESDSLSPSVSCTYKRPSSWTVGRVTCRDFLRSFITVADGQQFTDLSLEGGSGQLTVQCNNGSLVVLSKTCTFPGPGGDDGR